MRRVSRILVALAHMVLSRTLLMAGEHERVRLHAFAHYSMTTVTPIGYGGL